MKKTAFFLTTLCAAVVSAVPAFAGGGWYNEVCNNHVSVPEPSTLLLLGGAIAGMAFVRRLRKS